MGRKAGAVKGSQTSGYAWENATNPPNTSRIRGKHFKPRTYQMKTNTSHNDPTPTETHKPLDPSHGLTLSQMMMPARRLLT